MIRIIMFYSSREEVKWVQYISHVHVCWEFVVGSWGWLGGAMVLGKLPVPGRPTIFITIGQGPTALAVGAGGCCLDIFTLICSFSLFLLSLGNGPI